MTIKLEVVVKDDRAGLDIKVSSVESGVISAGEMAYMVGLMEAIDAFNVKLDKPTPGCNYPACKGRREANRGRSNLH